MQKHKIGLVLEGGGMRGLYTVGVLDILHENKLMPDYIVAVSAGACNAVSYISRQEGRGYRVIMDNIGDKRYVSFRNLIKTKSIFGMDFIFDDIPHRLDLFDYASFNENPCEFVVGVTDVTTGQPVFFTKEHMTDNAHIIRASSAIPVFSPIMEYQGGEYLDGGTSCPIPIKKALEDGCDKIIVVLTQHRGYVKSPEKFRKIYKRAYKQYPDMIHTLDTRHEIYNDSLHFVDKLEQEGKVVVVAPHSPLNISRFEHKKEKLQSIYEIGRADALSQLNEIKSVFEKNETYYR